MVDRQTLQRRHAGRRKSAERTHGTLYFCDASTRICLCSRGGEHARLSRPQRLRASLYRGAGGSCQDGVRAFIVTPDVIPPRNRNRLLVHVHGGCYVLNPGKAGLPEAIFMAGFGHFKVISVDYRMPPEAAYPAAHDDAM